MVDQDVLFEKIKQIKNCLKRIQAKTGGDAATLKDIDIQDIFVLNLQRAVQAALDLAAHVVADESLGLPSDLKENFIFLERAKIIDSKLSKALQKMVGFRNIAVHDYTALDPSILQSVLEHNLPNLESFYRSLLDHFGLSPVK